MNGYKTILLNKINRRDARLAVIGLGYVGLPLAVELAKAVFRTFDLDLDPRKVEAARNYP
jgi:UDP-N-acetyl-D-glucosamine dehydrogenase